MQFKTRDETIEFEDEEDILFTGNIVGYDSFLVRQSVKIPVALRVPTKCGRAVDETGILSSCLSVFS